MSAAVLFMRPPPTVSGGSSSSSSDGSAPGSARWVLGGAVVGLGYVLEATAAAPLQNLVTGQQLLELEAEVEPAELLVGAKLNIFRAALQRWAARKLGDEAERRLAAAAFKHGPVRSLQPWWVLGGSRDALRAELLPGCWAGVLGAAVGALAAQPFDLVRTRQAVHLFSGGGGGGGGAGGSVSRVGVRRHGAEGDAVTPGSVVQQHSFGELFRGWEAAVLHAVALHVVRGALAGAAMGGEDASEAGVVADALVARLGCSAGTAAALVRWAVEVTAAIAVTPLDIAKKRIQNRDPLSRNIPQALKTTFDETGPTGLFAGAITTAFDLAIPRLILAGYDRLTAPISPA